MGYRSTVAYRVVFADKELAKNALEDLRTRVSKIEYSTLDSMFDTIDLTEEGVLTLYVADVKWYESFEDVQVVEEWFNDICEQIENDDEYEIDLEKRHIYGCQFMRIGENNEDFDEVCNGNMLDNYLYYNRSIEL